MVFAGVSVAFFSTNSEFGFAFFNLTISRLRDLTTEQIGRVISYLSSIIITCWSIFHHTRGCTVVYANYHYEDQTKETPTDIGNHYNHRSAAYLRILRGDEVSARLWKL